MRGTLPACVVNIRWQGCPHRLTWMSAKGFIRMGQGEDDIMSRRACTQTLARLLLQVILRDHAPLSNSVVTTDT